MGRETYFGHAPVVAASIYERSIVAFAQHLARPEVRRDPKRKKAMLDAIEAAVSLMSERPDTSPVKPPSPAVAPIASSSVSVLRLDGYECERCTHQWVPRNRTRAPKVCPRCKSPYWDRKRRSEMGSCI